MIPERHHARLALLMFGGILVFLFLLMAWHPKSSRIEEHWAIDEERLTITVEPGTWTVDERTPWPGWIGKEGSSLVQKEQGGTHATTWHAPALLVPEKGGLP